MHNYDRNSITTTTMTTTTSSSTSGTITTTITTTTKTQKQQQLNSSKEQKQYHADSPTSQSHLKYQPYHSLQGPTITFRAACAASFLLASSSSRWSFLWHIMSISTLASTAAEITLGILGSLKNHTIAIGKHKQTTGSLASQLLVAKSQRLVSILEIIFLKAENFFAINLIILSCAMWKTVFKDII